MTTFYCVDSRDEFYVSIIRRDPSILHDDSPISDQMMGRFTGVFGLDGFIISSGSEMFPSRCEDEFITTQPQFDAFLESLRAEVERANTSASLYLPRESDHWELVVEEGVGGCFNLPLEDLNTPQLGYLFKHMAPWPYELTEELVNRAGLDYSECDEGSEDYWGVWAAAAEKLGITDVAF